MKKKHSTKEQRRKWRIEARDRDRAKHDRDLFARNLKRLYKMTTAQFEAMVKAQDGVCAICGEPPTQLKRQNRLYIDHDHATGQVRALLCHLCNAGIAAFERDPELVFRAYDYLQFYRR